MGSTIEASSALTLIASHEHGIRENWVAGISKAWRNDETMRWEEFCDVLEKKMDCLSILKLRLARDAREVEAIERHEQSTIDRIQSDIFVISDLFFEISSLKQCIYAEALDDSSGATLLGVSACLDGLFDIVLRDTSNIYEHVSELGDRGLILFNAQGIVTYANGFSRRLLQREDLTGTSLDSFVPAVAMAPIKAILSGKKKANIWSSELQFDPGADNSGKAHTIIIELAAVAQPTNRTVGYMALFETGNTEFTMLEALETLDRGVIKTDLNTKQIIYLNKEGKRILGIEDCKSLYLTDLVTDPKSRNSIEQNLIRRKQGHADVVEDIFIQHQKNKNQVPVRFTAIPQPDRLGRILTSFAFFESREIEAIEARIDKVIADDNVIAGAGLDWKRILKVTAQELSNYVMPLAKSRQTDSVLQITFSSFSLDEEFGRVEFHWDCLVEKECDAWSVRWYKIPPARLAWLKRPYIQNVLLEQFLDRKENEDLRGDEMIKVLLDGGIKRFLYRPIFRDSRIVAAVSFLSSDPDAFSEATSKLLDEFPLEKPVLAAFADERNSAERRLNDLTSELISCATMEGVAETLVEGIVKIFRWSNVAMFRVNDYDQTLDLICQEKDGENGYSLPRWLKHPISKGLIGRAAINCETIRSENIKANPQIADDYVVGNILTKSELALPICLSRRVCWVLNIEDKTLSAFADEEVKKIEFLVRQCERLLDGLAARYIYEATLTKTGDSVFITDHCGKIRRMNPAAKAQLRLTGQDNPSSLDEIFVESTDAKDFTRNRYVPARRVRMRRFDGAKKEGGSSNDTTELLLSMYQLPYEFRDRYLVGKNLDRHKRLERNEDIRHVFGQVARESRIPMTNIKSLFNRLQRQVNPKLEGEEMRAAVYDFVSRAKKQLTRLEILQNRLELYDDEKEYDLFRKSRVDLHTLIEDISKDLSTRSGKIIKCDFKIGEAEVLGDPSQLSFIYESVLGFLMMNLPLSSLIEVKAQSKDGEIISTLSAPVPESYLSTITGSLDSERDNLLRELKLGTHTIERFAKSNSGSFSIKAVRKRILRIGLTFPAAQD